MILGADLSMGYAYDKVGNVRNISYSPTSYENYSYDWLDRLVQAKGVGSSTWGSTITYGYDSMGNRLWMLDGATTTTYTYGAYNKLTKSTVSGVDTKYAYNRNGALRYKNTTSPQYQYAFNSMDQLTDVYKWTGSTRSLVASYYYDGSGARAKTVEGSTTTEYVYGGHDPICDKSGTAYTDYVYLNGRLKLKMSGTNSYWYIDDALGSTRLVYKGSTKVFSVTTYKPFGIAFGASGTEKFTYAGEMMDSPSGLFYLMARYYDPSIGRFISMDPKLGKLSMPQTLDRYTYCANNPINRVDPTGEFWNIIIGAIAGAIIGGVVAALTGGDILSAIAEGAIVGAITGLTFGLAAGIGIGAKAVSVGSKVVGAFSKVGEGALSVGKSALFVGKSFASKAASIGGKAFNVAKNVIGKAGDVLGNAGRSMLSTAEKLGGKALDAISTGSRYLQGGIDKAFGYGHGALQSIHGAGTRVYNGAYRMATEDPAAWQCLLSRGIETLGGGYVIEEIIRGMSHAAERASEPPGFDS